MEDNYCYYKDKSIVELRVIGRSLGVKAPTQLTKSELIEKIIALENGEEKPYFSRKGRPHYKIDFENFEKCEKEYDIEKRRIDNIVDIDKEKFKEMVLKLKTQLIVDVVDRIDKTFSEMLKDF